MSYATIFAKTILLLCEECKNPPVEFEITLEIIPSSKIISLFDSMLKMPEKIINIVGDTSKGAPNISEYALGFNVYIIIFIQIKIPFNSWSLRKIRIRNCNCIIS